MKRNDLRIDKTGRARLRGRFVDARTQQQVTDALAGLLTVQRVNGQAFIRDSRGRRVSAEVAELMEGGPVEAVKVGNSYKRLDVSKATGKAEKRAPRGTNSGGLKYELHFQSAPKLVGDNAANDRPQFLKYQGKVYRIKDGAAGKVQDYFLSLKDKYFDLFDDLDVPSPDLRIPLAETSAGDVFDLDNIELLDDELVDELADDEAAADAAREFIDHLKKGAERLIHGETKKAPKGRRKPSRRTGKR